MARLLRISFFPGFDRMRNRDAFFWQHWFNPPLIVWEYMLEEFCEGNHCDQYIHSPGGGFARCLMVQRELSRVGTCPLRYDTVTVKATAEENPHPPRQGHGEPRKKTGHLSRR